MDDDKIDKIMDKVIDFCKVIKDNWEIICFVVGVFGGCLIFNNCKKFTS